MFGGMPSASATCSVHVSSGNAVLRAGFFSTSSRTAGFTLPEYAYIRSFYLILSYFAEASPHPQGNPRSAPKATSDAEWPKGSKDPNNRALGPKYH